MQAERALRRGAGTTAQQARRDGATIVKQAARARRGRETCRPARAIRLCEARPLPSPPLPPPPLHPPSPPPRLPQRRARP